MLKDNSYGFIKPDSNLHGTTGIFFHRNYLVDKETELSIGDRVQFRVSTTKKGLEANDISVKVSVVIDKCRVLCGMYRKYVYTRQRKVCLVNLSTYKPTATN